MAVFMLLLKIVSFLTLVPEIFFRSEDTRQERKRSGEKKKPLVARDS